MAGVPASKPALAPGPSPAAAPPAVDFLAYQSHVSDGQILTACAALSAAAFCLHACFLLHNLLSASHSPAVLVCRAGPAHSGCQCCVCSIAGQGSLLRRLWVAAAAGLTCLILFGAVRNLLYTYRVREVSAAPIQASLLYFLASSIAPKPSASIRSSRVQLLSSESSVLFAESLACLRAAFAIWHYGAAAILADWRHQPAVVRPGSLCNLLAELAAMKCLTYSKTF